MTLNKSRLLVRWFFWSLAITDAFTENSRVWRVEERGTNLCFFFQTTLLWAPLTIAANLIVYAALVAAVLVAPVHWFGAWHYTVTILALAGIVGAVVGISSYVAAREDRREGVRARVSDQHGALSLGWQWIVAAKQRVCPMIAFTQGGRS